MFKSFLLAILLTTATSSVRALTCAQGENQMSIEGLEGVFCVLGEICMGTNGSGACPATQEGLPFGSYCGVVASGVYGCKTYSSAPTAIPEATTPTPVVTEPATTEPATTEPATTEPATTEPATTEPATTEPATTEPTTTEPATTEPATTKPATTVPATTESPTVAPVTNAPYVNCSETNLTLSVQGLQSAFCVNEPACVSNVSTGNCPGPQPGLEYGSYCDLLKTHVYGCKPYTADNQPSNATYAAPRDCSNNPAGETPVSIVGAEEDFCAPEPVCSGTIFGNCPQLQDGLTQDSECMVVDTGVYGCVFMASI